MKGVLLKKDGASTALEDISEHSVCCARIVETHQSAQQQVL